MEKEEIAVKLKKTADEFGVPDVLRLFAPDVRVRIPMAKAMMNTPVNELETSVRSQHGLMRNGARVVGDVADIIMTPPGLQGVRNLGRISILEIKMAMVSMAYGYLNDAGKTAFWLDVVQNNESATASFPIPAEDTASENGVSDI